MSTENEQKTEITVYWLEKSRSQRLIWLLEELKLKYDIKTYKRTQERLAPPELKKIHPLGKAPIISIKPEGALEPVVLAESGFIIEYLSEHFGKWLIPKQWIEGKEGQLGGETQEWMRYRYFMHYAEGSLMPNMLVDTIIQGIKKAPAPFFIKPITRAIAGKVEDIFIRPNYETNFRFVEEQLATSGGEFFCGKELTGADILISFQLEAGILLGSLKKEDYPKCVAFLKTIQAREAYKSSIKRVEEASGENYEGGLVDQE